MDGSEQTNEVRTSEYTRKVVDLVKAIAKAAQTHSKGYFIGSGLAIDLALGSISRDHHDIDFHPQVADRDWWVQWFKTQGFDVRPKKGGEYPDVYKVRDESGEEIVDLWPLKPEGEKLLLNHQGNYTDSGKIWTETRFVNFQGVNIRVENPRRVLEQKATEAAKGKPYRDQDLHDFRLLGEKPPSTSGA